MGRTHLHPCSPGQLGLTSSLLFALLLTLLLPEQETGGEEHQSGVIVDPFKVQKEEGLIIGKRG